MFFPFCSSFSKSCVCAFPDNLNMKLFHIILILNLSQCFINPVCTLLSISRQISNGTKYKKMCLTNFIFIYYHKEKTFVLLKSLHPSRHLFWETKQPLWKAEDLTWRARSWAAQEGGRARIQWRWRCWHRPPPPRTPRAHTSPPNQQINAPISSQRRRRLVSLSSISVGAYF